MINLTQRDRLRAKIEDRLGLLRRAIASAKSDLRSSSEIIPSVFVDELDCAWGETDLRTTVEAHNRSIGEALCLEHALTRMERGTYGLCEGCQDPLELRRLDAHPGAPFCVECQEWVEGGWRPPIQAPVEMNGSELRVA